MIAPKKPTFDLQLFAGAGDPATYILSNPAIQELSVIMREYKGEKWAPRNPGASVLGTKGAPIAKGATSPTYLRLVEKLGAEKAQTLKGLWISSDTPDGVDGDGDGSEDYEQILGVMFGSLGTPNSDPYGWNYYSMNGGLVADLQRAMQIDDIGMRSAAVASGIDTFLDALDDIRSGGDGTKKAALIASCKAGARHSKADMDHISAITNAAKAATTAAQTITDHAASLTAPGAAQDDGVGTDDEKAAAMKAEADRVAAAKAATDKAGADAAKVETPAAVTAESLLDLVRPLFDAQKASLEAALATHAAAVDAKLDSKTAEIADVAKAGAERADKLKASVDLMVSSARTSSAPGGGDQLEADGTTKAAPGTETSDVIAAPEIAPNTPVDQAFKSIQENARKARGRNRPAAS